MINACIFPAPQCSYTPDTVLDEDQKKARVRCDVVHIPVVVGGAASTFPSPSPHDGNENNGGGVGGATTMRRQTTASSTVSGQHSFTIGLLIHHPASPFLVVYAHPNAVDAGMMVEEMVFFSRKAQCSVLLWEYQGYGLLQDDPGILGPRHDAPVPGEEVLKDDMLAVYRYVTDELNVPSTQVILMGRSIGTGPSTWLASAVVSMGLPPPLLLFLQAPFSSIVDCVKSVMEQQRVNLSFLQPLASMVVADRFRNVDVIGDVVCDVVIQHGDMDEIVAYSHSQRLVEAARSRGKANVHLHTSKGFSHNNLSVGEAAMLLSATLRGMQGQWLPHALTLRPLKYHVAEASFFDCAMLAWQHASNGVLVADASCTLSRNAWHTVSDMQRACALALSDALADGTALQSRASLVKVVLGSVCAFVARLARLWQELDMVRKRHAAVAAIAKQDATPKSTTQRLASWWTGAAGAPGAAASSSPRAPNRVPYAVSLLQLLEELIAVTGSPLGVYELRDNVTRHKVHRRRWCAFGVLSVPSLESGASTLRFYRRGCSSSASDATADDGHLRMQRTLFELRWPDFLLRDILAMVEAAPLVLKAGVGSACDPFFFLTKQHVDRLQLQIERAIGFLPDDQWAALQQLLRQQMLPTQEEPSSSKHQGSQEAEADGEAESLLSLAEINDRAAALAARLEGTDPTADPLSSASLAAEWDELLCMTRNVATDDGLVRQHHSDGREVVALDPCWPTARELHQRVIRWMRGGLPPPPQSHRSDNNNKKSDEDCCVM